ncbi:MAG: DUF3842 family protein [Clostridia bacterium]|nr:DUF3842 family protein [Clostridia bacterium]
MQVLIIDGQGGKIGRGLIEGLLGAGLDDIIAVGTNYAATAAMMKAGAKLCATGENPVVVNAVNADIIAGPIGIIAANSLLGEVTPKMAAAVSESGAQKILVPINKCSLTVAGTQGASLTELTQQAIQIICAYARQTGELS